MTCRPTRWHLPGVDLHGERRGSEAGVPVLLVHGFGGSSADWDPVLDMLDPALPFLRYDLRGFGRSRAEDANAPFAHADDLVALLDAEGIACADIVGLSMGGAIALTAALDRPDRISRLVLVSPLIAGWDWSNEWRALWSGMTTAARAGDRNGARDLWFGHPLFETTRERADTAHLLRASIDAFCGDQWVDDAQRPALPDVERLPMLSQPTLLLTGGRDMADFRLMADLIDGAAPYVTRTDIAACGHMLELEAPEQCAREIERFLRRP